MIKIDDNVVIDINNEELSPEFKKFLNQKPKLKKFIFKVIHKTNYGVCTLLLPRGYSYLGFSKEFNYGPYIWRHYTEIHESYLKLVN